MEIRSVNFGFSVAITAAFLWSFYSVGNLFMEILVNTLVDGTIYSNMSAFNWTAYASKYIAQTISITLVTGILGWLVAEIYNELNEMFSLNLK